MTKPITSFTGEYHFLSNFYYVDIELDLRTYPTLEHAFQAAKTFDARARTTIQRARSPAIAKRIGRGVSLRPRWDEVRVVVMRRLVRQKFLPRLHRGLARKLLATGDAELVEGNHWRDTFWGQCPLGNGENHLGKILMEIRAELKEQGTLAR